MPNYTAPILDMLFILRHVLGEATLKTLVSDGLPDGLDAETAEAILQEAARLAETEIAPLNVVGDTQPPKLENGVVTTPKGWKDAYDAFRIAGWNGVSSAPEYGGQGLPWVITFALQEIWQSANMAFGLCPLLTQGAIEALTHHGSEDLKNQYLPKLISGEFTGTMNLTEPQAGSDLAAIRARAERVNDGTYRIFGQKIFITYGEHDMSENIIHLVLARLPDAPEGTKGISLFLVPKILPDGAHNDVTCTGLEHKLGIHASPTCSMSYGDAGGAVGYLVGDEHEGLKCMFTMMNNARLCVGVQGIGIAERAYQSADTYARERIQGGASIAQHADVRRMLMTMRTNTNAGRIMALQAGLAIDSNDAAIVDLMTPVIKSWCTDRGVDAASQGIQIYGGMGFIEESGAPQYYRDARILPIYEGTNGIQAADLVFRKIIRDRAGTLKRWIAAQADVLQQLEMASDTDFSAISTILSEAFDALHGATGTILVKGEARENDALGAVSHAYLNLLGDVMAGTALARAALAARDMMAAGDTAIFSPDYLNAQIKNARFFADHRLIMADALAHTVRTGADSV